MIVIEHGPEGRPCLFDAPQEVLTAHKIAEVGPALARAEALRQQGYWIAGYLTYEAGFAFEPRLQNLPLRGAGPLLVLGAFKGALSAEALLAERGEKLRLSAPKPLISRAAYEAAIAKVLAYIAAGDCYQVNLTFPLACDLQEGEGLALYRALRASGAVSHGAYVDFGIGPQLISRSPELFFRLKGGRIEARPMKGTRPRGATEEEDRAFAQDLAHHVKDRAENLMIVDLLRNDISRLAKLGTVKVPELFAIESYATVHQMVSSVTGELQDPPSLPALMAALFPCGSVTGAPKLRAMQIIHELEPQDRGAYCGAIGWMSPEGEAEFSVAIRTLSLVGRQLRLNVGGGVVQDSTAKGEWEEALWKTRFMQSVVKAI